MQFRDYLAILRKRWLLIVVCALLGLGGAAAISFSATPIYQASASVYFSLPFGNTASDLSQGSNYTQNQMLSYATLATMPAVLDPVIDDLQLKITPGQLEDQVQAVAQTDTVIIEIQASDPSPQAAADIANAVANQLGEAVKELAPKGADGQPVITTATVASASVPTAPVSPSTRRNLAAGFLAGLFVGALVAVLREVLDNTVRSPQVLRALGDAPVLGVIAKDSSAKKTPLIVDSHARSLRAEAFRQLRTNLQFIDVERPVHALVVTSSTAEEGKSTTAVNLAVAFSDSGRRVLLIEGDLRRPRVVDYLGLEGAVGLTNVLAGQVSIDEVLQPWGRGGLTVLPSGTIPPNPSELLGSDTMIELLAELRKSFDMIIIDTPPLLPVTDAAVAARLADGAVMVVRYGKTTRNQVNTSVRSLQAVDARVLGFVLTMAPAKGAEAYSAYGYYEEPKHPEESPVKLKPGKSVPSGQADPLTVTSFDAKPRHRIGLRLPGSKGQNRSDNGSVVKSAIERTGDEPARQEHL